MLLNLSIIIPLAPNETQHHILLEALSDEAEIILSQEKDRATSLNDGASKASGDYLWFLHADSRLPQNAVEKLKQAIDNHPDSLLFFDLAFEGGSPLMRLNAWGTNFRSHILKTPFGDQGLCIKKSLFEELNGYPENLKYGEDHVFVWRARQAGIAVQPVGETITTSARKYKQQGWLKTTLLHQYLWLKQAWPQWRKI